MKDAHLQLCRLVTQNFGAESRRSPLALGSSDAFWQDFAELADSNLVTSAIWPALQHAGLAESAPSDFRDFFRAANEWNTARNNAIQVELNSVISVLNRNSIVPVLLKGASYIKDRIYLDPGTRILGDLDILVDMHQIHLAEQVIRSIGYCPAGRPGRDYGDHHHLEPLRKSGYQAYVEIHREALARPLSSVVPASSVLRDAHVREKDGLMYAVPSPTHAAMISSLHSQVVDRCNATARVNIRNVMDISYLDAQYRDGDSIKWDEVLEVMSSNGLATPLRNYFYSLEILAGMDFSYLPPATLRQKFHHFLISAALDYWWLDKLMIFLDELTKSQLNERYNLVESGESTFTARLRHIGIVAKRMFRTNGENTS